MLIVLLVINYYPTFKISIEVGIFDNAKVNNRKLKDVSIKSNIIFKFYVIYQTFLRVQRTFLNHFTFLYSL